VKPPCPLHWRVAGLPVSGLLALAPLGFIAFFTETLPAGLLPQMGRSRGVGDALTGQLVTLSALGSAAAAMPGAVLTRSWPRRRVLLLAIGGSSVGAFPDRRLTRRQGSAPRRPGPAK
jgi:predicted MFS family arabinose efflux permease